MAADAFETLARHLLRRPLSGFMAVLLRMEGVGMDVAAQDSQTSTTRARACEKRARGQRLQLDLTPGILNLLKAARLTIRLPNECLRTSHSF